VSRQNQPHNIRTPPIITLTALKHQFQNTKGPADFKKMALIITSVAVAGFMRYKNQKAEREAQEKLEAEQSVGGNRSPDDSESSSSHDSENENKPLGPMGKFLLFWENLEKEVQKAQERKRREVIEAAFNEACTETFGKKPKGQADFPDIQAVSTLDSIDTVISEDDNMIEDSTSDQTESRAMVSTGAENCGEVNKTKPPKTSCISGDEFDVQHEIFVKAVDSTPNRPRIATE
jgi:hypothetical protein